MPRTKTKPARIFLATTILLALVLPLRAEAWLGELVGLAVDPVLDLILFILGMIVNFVGMIVIGISASLVNYVFTFQNFVKVPVVQIGWTLSRDLANMVFILIMLTMAFGTILRYESYGWKRLLPRLVLVALLINFSLIIGGAVIDVGNSLGRFFVSGGGENAAVGDFIMASVRAGQLSQLRNEKSDSAAFSPVTALIMTTVVQLVFYLILAFLLLAMGLIMIFRIVNLWILLVLAPLAWISYAIPGKSGYWNDWWKKFTTWALFPAYMGFFIFLGLLVGATFSGSPFASSAPDAGGFWSILFPDTLFSVIMQFIVVVAILFFGLAQAQSLSGAGAKTMMAGVGKMQAWGAGKLKGAGKVGVGLVGRGAKGLADKGLGKVGLPTTGQLREKLETKPLIGRAIGGPGARFQAQQKALKDAENKLKNLRPQDLRAILGQAAITPEGQARRAAALSQLADKGQLKDEDKKYIKDFQAAGGNIKDLLERRLDWAFDEAIQNLMAKDFNFPAVAAAWKKVADEATGTTQRLLEAQKAIQDIIPKKPEDLANLQKEAIMGTGANQMQIKELITEEFKDVNSITGKAGRLYASNLNSMIYKNPAAYQELMEHLKQPPVRNTLKQGVQDAILAGPPTQVFTTPAAPAAPAATTPPTPAGTTP